MFSKRLNEIRKEKGFTAQYMADTLYVSLRTYQRYESGEIKPPVDTLIKIADILDVSLDYLVGRTDKK